MKIPKLSAPLTKFIRTSEGILVWVFNAALVAGVSVPSAHLSAKDAAILAAINNGLAVISRTALKAHLGTTVAGLGFAPLTPAGLGNFGTLKVGETAATAIGDVAQDTAATPSVAEVGDQIAALATDARELSDPAPPAAI